MFILLLTLAVVAILSLALFLYEHRLRLKALPKTQETSSSQLDLVTQDSNEIIHSAIKKSQAILSSAELDALKTLAVERYYIQEFTKKIEHEFTDSLAGVSEDFKKKVNTLGDTQIKMAEDLNKEALSSDKTRNDLVNKQFNDLLKKLDENILNFIDQTQKKGTQQVQMELNAARQMIDNYKSDQMRILDENIVAVLERTLALVLNKNISLDSHVDLVFEALDRAKKEKFFT